MNTKYNFCSSIGPTIVRYLRLKQALGRQYEKEYWIFVHLDKFLYKKMWTLPLKAFRCGAKRDKI